MNNTRKQYTKTRLQDVSACTGTCEPKARQRLRYFPTRGESIPVVRHTVNGLLAAQRPVLAAILSVQVPDYGLEFASVVGTKNLVATQFHLEKSGEVGLRIYDNFFKMAGGAS